jgi:HEAT repeat protein
MRNLLILIAVTALLLVLALPFEEIYEIRGGRERTLDEAVEELASPSYRTRERALRRLVSLGDSSLPRLEQARGSENAEVRHRARLAIAGIERAGQSIDERRAEEFGVIVRWGLAEANALRPGSERFRILRLDDAVAVRTAVVVAEEVERDALYHQRAVRLVADLGQPEGAPYLASLLERGHFLPSTLHEAATGLERFGTGEVVPALVRGLRSSDPFARKYAVRTIGRLGNRDDCSAVRTTLSDPSVPVRAEAAGALARLGGPGAMNDLLDLTRDADSTVRSDALAALARLPGPDAAKAARKAIADPEEIVRTRALLVLGERGNESDRKRILPMTADENLVIRAEAVRTLGRIGCEEEAVRIGLRDASPAVRRVALIVAKELPVDLRRSLFEAATEETDSFLRAFRDALIDGTVAD